MSNKPIFVATHPRACSTAFERVFMTRHDTLHCVHEPFGDAFYYGPERLSERFENDEEARTKSGFADVTFKDVVDGLKKEMEEHKDKRLFIKDIIHYLFRPDGKPTEIAPSLRNTTTSSNTNTPSSTNGTTNNTPNVKNPTVLPTPLLSTFHFTFLIRHPRRAIPSYYRCTIPPLSSTTGFTTFLPSEAGYDELRRFFDFLLTAGIIGGDGPDGVKVTVVDADDMLDRPAEVIRAYCEDVGVEFSEDMLSWGGGSECQERAKDAFEKWKGFHEDALGSTGLKARVGGAKNPTTEEEDEQWRQKFGEAAQKVIRDTVNANIPDYEYLKQFALKV